MFGETVAPEQSSIPLPDETDRIFYDTAVASGAVLITGNKKDYPDNPFIFTPADFLRRMCADVVSSTLSANWRNLKHWRWLS